MGTNPVTRRSVLKTTGVAGGLAASFQTLPEQVGAAERKQNIVMLREGEEVAKRVSVGKRWYRHLQRARQVLENRQDQLLAMDGVHSVGLERRGATIDGLRKQALFVRAEPGASIDVPGEYDGVEVRLSHEQPPKPSAPNCYDTTENPIPGGTANEGEAPVGVQTLCCRGLKDGSSYMLAARHGFALDGWCDTRDVTGTKWYQPKDNGDPAVGRVADEFFRHDLVLLDTSLSSRNITDSIIDEDGKVVGRVTKDGLSYLKSNDITVQKRGTITCRETGQVTATGKARLCGDLINGIHDLVYSTPTQIPGDSGGPVYYEDVQTNDTDKLYLAHIATHFLEKNDNAVGASANKIFNLHGVWFGGNPFEG